MLFLILKISVVFPEFWSVTLPASLRSRKLAAACPHSRYQQPLIVSILLLSANLRMFHFCFSCKLALFTFLL
jgi:hypothetical protein